MERNANARMAGIRVIRYPEIGSTNAEALALARRGERGPVWIVAREQTAGRGRRGRSWVSPPGNLYATLLLTDACAAACAPQLSLVAALALADALAATAPALAREVTLKWPNDVLLGDAKVAGILIEGETLADGRFAVAIGIGVNCAAHPPDTAYPATALWAAGCDAAPDVVLAALSSALQARLAAWNTGIGFAQTRADWLARAARLGQSIALSGHAEREGVFEGLDEDGRLLLRASDGTVEAFAAAEVSFRAQQPGKGNAG